MFKKNYSTAGCTQTRIKENDTNLLLKSIILNSGDYSPSVQ